MLHKDQGHESFVARLEKTLESAQALGYVSPGVIEALHLRPDFDALAYHQFAERARALGLPIAEGSAAPAPPRPPRAADAGGDGHLLDLYLREIGRVPLLEHHDLLALARRARAGDPVARRRMILANLRLVVHVARAYRNRGLPFLDLIEEGNLGLIQAVDRFEPERGLRFSTYATIWIRQSILRGIAEQSRSVRIPVRMFQHVKRYLRADQDLRARMSRDPDVNELAREMRISPARVEGLARLVAGIRSLDQETSLDAFEQLAAHDSAEPPLSVEDLVELQLEHERLDRVLRRLPLGEERILRIRYGFFDGVAHTLADTGARFGISRERVRQIESRALARLRRFLGEGASEGAPSPGLH